MSDRISKTLSHTVPKNSLSSRIDSYLSQQSFGITRNQIQKLIKNNLVQVNGKSIETSYKIRPLDQVVIQIPPPEILEEKPESIPLEIIYEDAEIALINKPAELVVHVAAGHSSGTLVNALLYHLKDLSSIGGKFRPGIVHRLDKGTSGIMLVAKTNQAHLELTRQFEHREIEKTYLALAYGIFKKEEGIIKSHLGRSRANRKKISSKTRRGREAVTGYHVLKSPSLPLLQRGIVKAPPFSKGEVGGISLLELKPKTGRTHQLRVHLAEAGHPVIGDPLYGGRQWINKLDSKFKELVEQLNRQALHAWKIKFKHPTTKKVMEFEAKIPDDMQKILDLL